MSEQPDPRFLYMRKPIEIGDADFFQVELSHPTATRRDAMEHRFRAKKAIDVKDDEVAHEDLEALRWLREKRGVVEDGKSYTIQKFSEALQVPYKETVPARPVTVEIPTFCNGCDGAALGSGPTLRDAVEAVKAVVSQLEPGDTYPGRNEGLDRVLVESGPVKVRVSDLCALIRDYMDEHPSGGTLHCSLSDGNMEGDVRWEVDHVKERYGVDDPAARLIAELLMLMPEDARKKLYERGFGR